jgi:hypothetical protein
LITHLGTHVVVDVGARNFADIAFAETPFAAIARSHDFRRLNQSALPARTW